MMLRRLILPAAATLSLSLAITTLLALIETTLALVPAPVDEMSFDGATFSVWEMFKNGFFFLVSASAFASCLKGRRDPAWCRKAGWCLGLIAAVYGSWGLVDLAVYGPHSASSTLVLTAVWILLSAGCFWLGRTTPPSSEAAAGG